MNDTSPAQTVTPAAAPSVMLPTRQYNALRLLLDKSLITPEDVAQLDYRTLERANGIGAKSVELIHAWLRSHGHEPNTQKPKHETRVASQQRRLTRAIDYLKRLGYEVRAPADHSSSKLQAEKIPSIRAE